MSSILLIQSDPDARAHLIDTLNADPCLSVYGAVDTLAQARAHIAQRIPDLLISDLRLRDGTLADLVSELRPGRSHALALASSLHDPYLMHALCHGVVAYALVGRPREAMLPLTRRVLAGESPMAPEIARSVLALLDAPDTRPVPVGRHDPRSLSAMDRQLLQWLGEGYLLEEIALSFEITPQLVGVRIRSLYRKLQQDRRERMPLPKRR